MTTANQSPYLLGSYAPIDSEIEAECQLIDGQVPPDLDGLLVRNGPNPRFEPAGRHHWFDGDGMLHACRVSGGRVHYRNRWIRTDGFDAERRAGQALWGGIMESIAGNPKAAPYKDTSNTDVIFHAGVLKSLWYLCGPPYRIDPHSLETLGKDDFGGTYTGVVSSHSKVDEATGELLFFDFGLRPPFMHFGIADASGVVTRRMPVELPGPRIPHDLAITQHYAILMDLPVVFDQRALAKGQWRTVFEREMPARFGLALRSGDGPVRWFEAQPCYVYHSINAWEEGDEVVMVGCRVPEPFQAPREEDGIYAVMMATLRIRAELYRWRFNLKTGQTREERLDDRNTEFPMMDRRRLGQRSRYSYNMLIGAEPTVFFDGIAKYDTDTGASDVLELGPGRRASEAPFAPRIGAQAEDDGYVLSMVHDERENRSELWIVDAREPSRGTVARLAMPQRVPCGFHALWVNGDKLGEA